MMFQVEGRIATLFLHAQAGKRLRQPEFAEERENVIANATFNTWKFGDLADIV
jgi:hypothetical protein